MPPSHNCLYLLDNVVVWTDWLICLVSLPEGATDSVSEHRPMHRGVTMLLCEMFDVSRYGPHRGKLHPLFHGWSV